MLAAIRVAVGVAGIVAPRRASAVALGTDATNRALGTVVRSFAARDLVLGLGTLRALDADSDAPLWTRASAAADALDVVAVLLAWRGLPRGRATLAAASAAAAAALGTRAASRLG